MTEHTPWFEGIVKYRLEFGGGVPAYVWNTIVMDGVDCAPWGPPADADTTLLPCSAGSAEADADPANGGGGGDGCCFLCVGDDVRSILLLLLEEGFEGGVLGGSAELGRRSGADIDRARRSWRGLVGDASGVADADAEANGSVLFAPARAFFFAAISFSVAASVLPLPPPPLMSVVVLLLLGLIGDVGVTGGFFGLPPLILIYAPKLPLSQ